MQVTETELVIPLIDALRKPGMRIRAIGGVVAGIAGLIAYFLLDHIFPWPDKSANGTPVPDMGEHLLSALLIALCIFVILLSILLVVLQVRSSRVQPYMRINQEGIFTSRDSLLIKWAEIKELSSSIFMGYPYFRIVPWNLEEFATQTKASSKFFVHFNINIMLWLSSFSKSSAPIGVNQRILPIPIDELLNAIQEQFAPELREYHITISGRQN